MKVIVVKRGRLYEDDAIRVLRESLDKHDDGIDLVTVNDVWTEVYPELRGDVIIMSPFALVQKSLAANFDTPVVDGVDVSVLAAYDTPVTHPRLYTHYPEDNPKYAKRKSIRTPYLSSDFCFINAGDFNFASWTSHKDGGAMDTINMNVDVALGVGLGEVHHAEAYLHPYRHVSEQHQMRVRQKEAVVSVAVPADLEILNLPDTVLAQSDFESYYQQAIATTGLSEGFMMELEGIRAKQREQVLQDFLSVQIGYR